MGTKTVPARILLLFTTHGRKTEGGAAANWRDQALIIYALAASTISLLRVVKTIQFCSRDLVKFLLFSYSEVSVEDLVQIRTLVGTL